MSWDLCPMWPFRVEHCFKITHWNVSNQTFKDSGARVSSVTLRNVNLRPWSSSLIALKRKIAWPISNRPPIVPFQREPLETAYCDSLSLSWTHLHGAVKAQVTKVHNILEHYPNPTLPEAARGGVVLLRRLISTPSMLLASAASLH